MITEGEEKTDLDNEDLATDKGRRLFLTAAATVAGGVGAAATAVPFISTMTPSARARAIGAPVEVDLSDIEPGGLKIEMWQGKPVWILRRSDESVEELASIDGSMADPNSDIAQQPGYAQNKHRSVDPEFLIVLGVCTHLGCSPKYVTKDAEHNLGDDWIGGFYCPCHGSRFDLAGRVFAGVPAPSNLIVPPHKYIDDTTVLIGDDSGVS